MFESGRMSQLRRSAAMAGLCLYACGNVLVQDAGGAALDQAPSAPAQLDIMVSVGSKPVPSAAVIAAEEGLQHVASARTDQQGRALLSVPPGRYRVSASLEGHHMQVTVARAASGSSVSVRLALTAIDPFALVPPGSGVVSGRVLATNGDPVPYASVSLYDGFNPGGSGSTAADGTFRFTSRAHPSPNSAYNKVSVSQSAHIWPDVPATVFLADRTELSRSVQVREKQETSGLELRVSTSLSSNRGPARRTRGFSLQSDDHAVRPESVQRLAGQSGSYGGIWTASARAGDRRGDC
jgi:Carboxypeptidase regulatory-like domain